MPLVVYAGDKGFLDSVNESAGENWIGEVIVLKNECDFSRCRTSDCARDVFSDTIFRQESEYVSGKYGEMGKEWDVSGESAVRAETFSSRRFYDDLGISVFGTAENIVLHFEITSSVEALNNFNEKSN